MPCRVRSSLFLSSSFSLSLSLRMYALRKRPVKEARSESISRWYFLFFFSFFSFFLFLIDRMIILSFDQINEHSRAASPIHSSSWRGCCRHDTNKKKNYPRLANEPLVRSNFCGTGFFIVNRHVSRIRCNGIPAIYRFSSPVKYSR